MGGSAEVVFNHLPELLKKVVEETERIIAETALKVEDQAKSAVKVEHGAAKAGIYHVTKDESTYSTAVSAAQANESGKTDIVPEVEKPESPQEAIVAGATAHNLFLELGTHKMGAEPYLTPALEGEREKFTDALARIFSE